MTAGLPIFTPDLCVIGAGSAGLSAAAGASAFGLDVVLVERGAMGGDCLNHGCVPSKALLHAAAAIEAARRARGLTGNPPMPQVDFGAVMAGVRSRIDALAPHDSVERFECLGVRVIKASARFADRSTVEAGAYRIRARRFVIATGSRPFIPDIPGLASVPYLTSDTIFSLSELPEHLIVLGGGGAGVELAQAFARLGSRVTVVEAACLLAGMDRELVPFVTASLEREGVLLHEGARPHSVSLSGARIAVRLMTGEGPLELSGSHLFVATGRRPNVDGLDLEKAGLGNDEGPVATDDGLRTANPAILAIGDVRGADMFTHAAGAEASLALQSILFRLPGRRSRLIIPAVLYTHPELAQAGLTEEEARRRRQPVQVLRIPFGDNDRAVIEGARPGLLKLVLSPRGRILGVAIAGEGAAEMMGFWLLALSRRLRLSDLRGLVLPYPTLCELSRRAALVHARPLAAKRWLRGLVRFLARFG